MKNTLKNKTSELVNIWLSWLFYTEQQKNIENDTKLCRKYARLSEDVMLKRLSIIDDINNYFEGMIKNEHHNRSAK